jgi:succinate dehydrogenase/fumarate reductase flavoprotein subunit
MDFTKNISWKGKSLFLPYELDQEVSNYLVNSGSMQSTPIERLISLNSPAVDLFREHHIDLASEPLEIGVCAQHNNGGLKGNIWWESDLRHLFPVGEVNGSHGVSRPGGSALNSGQVGSNRAAEYISRRYNTPSPGKAQFLAVTENNIAPVLELANYWLSSDKRKLNKRVLAEIRYRMSGAGSIVRNRQKVSKAADEASSLHTNIKEKISASSTRELAECFKISDACLTHMMWLEAIRSYIEKNGRSRGSYIITDLISPELNFDLCKYDRDVESNIQELNFRKGKTVIKSVKAREIPLQNLWFEKVWKDYLEDNYIEG